MDAKFFCYIFTEVSCSIFILFFCMFDSHMRGALLGGGVGGQMGGTAGWMMLISRR